MAKSHLWTIGWSILTLLACIGECLESILAIFVSNLSCIINEFLNPFYTVEFASMFSHLPQPDISTSMVTIFLKRQTHIGSSIYIQSKLGRRSRNQADHEENLVPRNCSTKLVCDLYYLHWDVPWVDNWIQTVFRKQNRQQMEKIPIEKNTHFLPVTWE